MILRLSTTSPPMDCDCGTCCNACGHDTNCAINDAPASDPSDDYTA